MNENQIVRFIDTHAVETMKQLKEAAIENQKNIEALKKTLLEASNRINQMLQELI